jgi:hypothetical protein
MRLHENGVSNDWLAFLLQQAYTEGPIWRVQLIRVKPNQMDTYLTSLRQSGHNQHCLASTLAKESEYRRRV